jgi:hypothetical protein
VGRSPSQAGSSCSSHVSRFSNCADRHGERSLILARQMAGRQCHCGPRSRCVRRGVATSSQSSDSGRGAGSYAVDQGHLRLPLNSGAVPICSPMGVQLVATVEDRFIWKWTASQQYSAASAYRAFFHGQCGLPGARTLAKTRAPACCKFFIWLSLLDRCWTSARLQCHNLQNSGPRILCCQADELMSHLLLQCAFSREVWFRILRVGGFQYLAPMPDEQWPDWWLRRRK